MKIISFLFVFLAATLALATRARIGALNSSPHLIDEQLVFANPIDLNYLEELVSLESGSSNAGASATTTTTAEGFVSKRWNEKSYAVAIGHQNELIYRTRAFMNSLGFSYRMQQNPIDLFFAGETDEANWATSLFYSNFQDKVSGEKEISAGLSVAAEVGPWQVTAKSLLNNKVETATNKLDGSGGLSAGLNYIGDNFEAFASFAREPVKSEGSGIETDFHIIQVLRLGLVDSNAKEFNDIFWGGEIVTVKVDCRRFSGTDCDQAYVNTMLPVWFGFELQAASWLKLRSSIKQTVLINQSRDEVGYPSGYLSAATGGLSEYTNGPNTTSMTAGFGILFNRFTLDALLSASTSQQINSTNFANQVSLKYVF